LVAALPLVVLSMLRCADRLLDWRDEQTLWVAAMRDTPGTFVEMSYAHALRRDGLNLAAHQRFRAALEGEPPRPGVCLNVIGSALAADRLDLALTGASMAEKRGCSRPEFYGYWAACHAYAGQWGKAKTRALLATGDTLQRSDLVLAAVAVVEGRADGYDQIEVLEALQSDAREQIASMLRRGEHPDLATVVLAQRKP
jgi:hypothetical protein